MGSCIHYPHRYLWEYDGCDQVKKGVKYSGLCTVCGQKEIERLSGSSETVSFATLNEIVTEIRESMPRLSGKCLEASRKLRKKLHREYSIPSHIQETTVGGCSHWVVIISGEFVQADYSDILLDPTSGQFDCFPQQNVLPLSHERVNSYVFEKPNNLGEF